VVLAPSEPLELARPGPQAASPSNNVDATTLLDHERWEQDIGASIPDVDVRLWAIDQPP
jgi:hypothetical protein